MIDTDESCRHCVYTGEGNAQEFLRYCDLLGSEPGGGCATTKNHLGDTLLHTAAEFGRYNIAKVLQSTAAAAAAVSQYRRNPQLRPARCVLQCDATLLLLLLLLLLLCSIWWSISVSILRQKLAEGDYLSTHASSTRRATMMVGTTFPIGVIQARGRM